MVYSLSRETFDKRKPTTVACLYLKNFDQDNFNNKLKKKNLYWFILCSISWNISIYFE